MISEHIRRNTCFFIFFNQADSESAYWAIKILQIDDRNAKLLRSLPPGICICCYSQTGYSTAFLAEIDFIPPARYIGNIEYSTHDFTPATDNKTSQEIIQKLEQSIKPATENANKKSDLEELALKLLHLSAENPYFPVIRLFEKMGTIRHETQIKIRETLENKSLGLFEEPRIGSKNQLLMEITETGYNLLGIDPPNRKGRGSITHRHYAAWIARFFEEQGCNTYIEHVLEGTNHPVDVLIESKNHFKVFEISVTATANLISHIEACFDKATIAIESVTIITGQKKEHKRIKDMIKGNVLLSRYKDKIILDVIDNFMPKEFKK